VPENTTLKPQRLCFADGLRGIAALWVVLFHLSEGNHIPAIKSVLPEIFYKVIFDWGHLGVPIFFVLSGFVMALTAQKVLFNPANALKFISRRLVRLAPPYYVAIAVSLTLLLVKSHALNTPYSPPTIGGIVQHLFFVQDIFNTPQINLVFWTLCIEVQFYIAFALLLLAADALQAKNYLANARFKIFGAVLVISFLWPLGILKTALWQGGFIGFWFSYLLGVMVCWAWLNKAPNKTKLSTFTAAACGALLMIGAVKHDSFALIAAIAASVMLVAAHKNKMHIWFNWVWLQWLGLISYSLYLLHNPVTGASARIAKKITGISLSGEILAALFTLTICLIVAYLSFLLIERPSIRWSHRFKLSK
jgi:peptidoglycan/LPS O-acetylase OafA/YrhL